MTDLDLAIMCLRAYNEHTGSVGDLEYLVEDNVVAIRGTEFSRVVSGLGVIDIARNMRILPWYDRRVGWAHAGMLKGAQAIYRRLQPRVSKNLGCACIDGRRSIHITGHSLGAGVGLLLAHMLEHDGMLVTFTGFGTPRCMISRVNPRLNATMYRNGDDAVTQIPRWWMGGYHPLPTVEIGDKAGFEALSDHALEAYINSLMKMV